MKRAISFVVLAACLCVVCPAKTVKTEEPEIKSQWAGKKVAFLGDSITDKAQVARGRQTYWSVLEKVLGIKAYPFAVSGKKWDHVTAQVDSLRAHCGDDIDAIMIMMGTNDFVGDVPIGEWYTLHSEYTQIFGAKTVRRLHKEMNYDNGILNGRINTALKYIKELYPTKQVILLTPLHRGFFRASSDKTNIQPDEYFSNAIGLFIEDYVRVVREAGDVWSVPVIDLFSISGLYPMLEQHHQYYTDDHGTDFLHPCDKGHRRLAYVIAYQLLGYPSSFED